jgi:hypothetical protein
MLSVSVQEGRRNHINWSTVAAYLEYVISYAVWVM